MRLTTEQRQVVADLIDEAHAASITDAGQFPPAEVAERFVASLHEAEGAAPEWIGAYLDSLAVDGAKRACADWRRSHQLATRTAKGTPVDMPAYAGVKRTDEEGVVSYVQMPLIEMDLAALRAHKVKLAANRDTLSREIRLVSDLIAVMEADESLSTVGAALEHLRRAS